MNRIEKVREAEREEVDFPVYFHHEHDTYYRLDGPEGPAYNRMEGYKEQQITLYHLVMEARCDGFERCFEEETPWG